MHVRDLFDLTGKVAIVTGGGRGLGSQIAEGLGEAGANLVICSRKIEACEETRKYLVEKGVQCLALQCDVRNPLQVQQVVDKTMEHFGRVDILVNNSGTTWGAPVIDMPLEAWNKVMDINVTGTFLMSQAVGKVMIEQKAGKIINIASVSGLVGSDPRNMDAISYSTSKGAVISFTRDLAVKWGQYNIHVNAIAPGFFPTKMSKQTLAEKGDRILELTPLKRFGSDQDLKGAAVFLASDASNYVTGTILTVDGGKYAM